MSATLTKTTPTTYPNPELNPGLPAVTTVDTISAELVGRRAQAGAIASAAEQIVAPIVAGFRFLARAWAHQGDVSRAYAQLKRFDDRMLADIGLDRANLLASLQQSQTRNAQTAPGTAETKAAIADRAHVMPAANLDHPTAKPSRAA